jgi:hypothetical protein
MLALSGAAHTDYPVHRFRGAPVMHIRYIVGALLLSIFVTGSSPLLPLPQVPTIKFPNRDMSCLVADQRRLTARIAKHSIR